MTEGAVCDGVEEAEEGERVNGYERQKSGEQAG